jgi:tetratricopeptide (TPR) repeat protein
MAKISRNDKCPCGSGKKYKHCCINFIAKTSNTVSSQFDFIDDKSKYILEVGGFLDELKLNPDLINDPSWWGVLGATLSQNDDHISAGSAFKKAYKISNKDPIHLLNIAANHSMQGDSQKGLEALKKVPKNTKRKSIITGNILLSLNEYEKAIPFYEKAINEEPDFYLAYSNLLTCLTETDSQSIDYWFKKSLSRFPNEFSILQEYLVYLFVNSRLDDLYEFGQSVDVNNLDQERDDVVVHHDRKGSKNLLSLYIQIGKIHRFKDPENISKAVDFLNNNCQAARHLLPITVNTGNVSNVKKVYSHICDDCKAANGQVDKHKFGDLKAFEALAYQESGEVKQAYDAAKKSINKFPENINALQVAWWTADDLGMTSEAIEYAKLLQKFAPVDSPQYEHIDYNLAWLYMKDGNLALASHFYKKSIEVNHLWGYEGLALCSLLNTDINEAQKVWEDYSEKSLLEEDFNEDLVHFSFAYSVDAEVNISEDKKEVTLASKDQNNEEVSLSYYLTDNNKTLFNKVTVAFIAKDPDQLLTNEREKFTNKISINVHDVYRQPSFLFEHKTQKWNELINLSKNTLGSQSYSIDLISKNNETDPAIGAGIKKLKKHRFSQDDFISAIQDHDSLSKKEVLHYLEMDKRGDLSEILFALKEKIPAWDYLPDEAKSALMEGYKRISTQNSIDYAPVIVTIVKSLEISLKGLLFDKFKESCELDIHLNQYIEIGLQPKFKQAHNFIRFIEKGAYLELGSMNHILKLANGKTGNKLPLLNMLNEFILESLKWNAFGSGEIIEKLDYLSDMRNPAAHAKTFSLQDAKDVRDSTFEVYLAFH